MLKAFPNSGTCMNSKRLLRHCLLALVCISLCGCTTMRPVDFRSGQSAAGGAPAREAIRAGDQLRAALKDQSTVEFTVSEVGANELHGVDRRTNLPVKVAFADLASIERQEKDSMKTTLLVLAIVFGAVVLIKAVTASHILGSA